MRSMLGAVRLLLIGTILLALSIVTSQADEPAAEFLDALRAKGYYDVAFDYLGTLENDPAVSQGFRRTLLYQRANTLIDQAAHSRDSKLIDSNLAQAQEQLAEYAKQSDSLLQTVKTKMQLGRILTKRADLLLRETGAEAGANQLTTGEKEKLQLEARGYLTSALADIKEAKAGAKRLLDPSAGNPDALKIDAEDPETLENRRRVREYYQQLTVHQPSVGERLADTYPMDSKNREKLLQGAADYYTKVWTTYPKSASGVQACVYAGRSMQKLGRHKEAIGFFNEVLNLEVNAWNRSAIQEAYVLATDSWRETKPYPAKKVIMLLEPAVDRLNRKQRRLPSWQRVILELGYAKNEIASIIADAGEADAATNSKSMKRNAAKLVREVAKFPGLYRDSARELLALWGVPAIDVEAEVEANQQPMDTFVAAFEAAKGSISNIENLAAELRRLKITGASRDQIAALESRTRKTTDDTIRTLDLAVRLADDSMNSSDINRCRFYKSYCYFASGRYLEASIIGRFLLEKFPTDASAKSVSGWLLKSQVAMLAEAPESDKQLETQALNDTAMAIAQKWPGSSEATAAVNNLIDIAINQQRLDDAVGFLKMLPAESQSQGALQSRLGRQIYASYKSDLKNPEVPTDVIHEKLKQAREYLSRGAAVAPGQLTYADAVGGLMLVDAHLASGDANAALAVLDESSVSPLSIIKNKPTEVFNNAAVSRYKSDAYRLIVRTYIGKLQQGERTRYWIDKSNGVIESMRQEAKASGDPRDQAGLAAINQLIVIELKKSFAQITQPDEQAKFANTLADFLRDIEGDSQSGRVVLTAGATLMGIANELSANGKVDEARKLFSQAVSALNRAEKLGFAGEKNKSVLERELKRQRALAQRGQGDYEKSVAQFVEILKTTRAFDIQIDAASTLQQWGKSAKLAKPLVQAVNGTGSYTDPKTKRNANAIWGWKKILRAAQGDKKKYREQYYLALYSVVEAKFESSRYLKKTSGYDKAIEMISDERKRAPDFLDSVEWKNKFSDLEKKIQDAK